MVAVSAIVRRRAHRLGSPRRSRNHCSSVAHAGWVRRARERQHARRSRLDRYAGAEACRWAEAHGYPGLRVRLPRQSSSDRPSGQHRSDGFGCRHRIHDFRRVHRDGVPVSRRPHRRPRLDGVPARSLVRERPLGMGALTRRWAPVDRSRLVAVGACGMEPKQR